MTVLADLRDEHARRPAFVLGKCADEILHARDGRRAGAGFARIYAGYNGRSTAMAAKYLLKSEGNFADGRLGPRGLNRKRQEVGSAFCAFAEGIESARGRGLIAPCRGLNAADLNRILVRGGELVHANPNVEAAVDARLGACGGFLDAPLRDAGLDGPRHSSEIFDFVNMRKGSRGKRVSERLDVIRTAPGVDHARRAGLFLKENLRIAREPC